MANLFTCCCVVIPILLSIILAILNSDNAQVNELLAQNILGRFKTGILCLELTEESNKIIAYGELPSVLIKDHN